MNFGAFILSLIAHIKDEINIKNPRAKNLAAAQEWADVPKKRGMNMAKMTIKELITAPTSEELLELEKAAAKVPVFDEDNPELTGEQLLQFKRMYHEDHIKQTVSLLIF